MDACLVLGLYVVGMNYIVVCMKWFHDWNTVQQLLFRLKEREDGKRVGKKDVIPEI